MAISNYVELKDAAANWLARDDLTARIPEFITLCEAKLNRLLFVRQMEVRSTTSADTSNDEPEFISLPSDFQTMRRIRLPGVVGKPALKFLTGTQMDEVRYSFENVSDQPAYFSFVGNEIELLPTPNEDYELEMVYRAKIPALADNATNWLLTLAPDIYLYGTLLESAPHIKEDARIAVWASAFATTLSDLNALGDRVSYDSGPSSIVLPGVTP